MTRLDTDRLLLTALTEADFPALVALYGKPPVMRYIVPGGRSETESREVLGRMLAQAQRLGFDGDFLLRSRKDSALVGTVLLIERTPGASIELGYAIDEPFWGLGYAFEATRALVRHAFTTLALPRLTAVVIEENEPSVRVLRKLGMRELWRAADASGVREIRFALERTEWPARPGSR